jgi:phage shock protein A
MGVFARISDIISANVSALLDRAENPELMIAQIIREMEQGLEEARRHAATAIAAERRLGREVEQNRFDSEYWKNKARVGLGLEREDLARQALARKREHDELVRELEEQHAAAVRASASVKSSLRAFEARLAETRRKQRVLLVRHRAAKARQVLDERAQLAVPNFGVTQAKFGRFENQIITLEDELEARAEINFSLGRVASEFTDLEAEAAIDRELTELKREKNRALPSAPPKDV